MRPHATRRIILTTLLAIALSCLVLTNPTAKSSNLPVPTITLSTIQGFTAEISDYSTTAEGFTFTVTNRTHLELTALGADLGPRIPASIISQSGGGFQWHVDAFIEGSEFFNNQIAGVQMSFVMSGSLGPGESRTFTLDLGGDPEFIAHHLFVSFFPELQFHCGDRSNYFREQLLIQFTRLEENQQCLVFTNLSTEVMTGIVFDYPEDRGPFELLAITPSRQPFNQHLRFSKIAEPISSLSRADFGILSGGRFAAGANQNGVQPGETTSEFCFAGNFAGLSIFTYQTIIDSTFVRANNVTRQCVIQGPPVGGGQTGILAGEPR